MKPSLPVSFTLIPMIIKHSRPNPTRSHRDLVQIQQDLIAIRRNLGQVLIDPARFWPNLDKSSQISAPMIKPKTDSIQLETDET